MKKILFSSLLLAMVSIMQVGSKECNPQYIFGNYEYQVYVDGVNGNVQTENPAFGGDFGKPLGEWL